MVRHVSLAEGAGDGVIAKATWEMKSISKVISSVRLQMIQNWQT
jgi:hypothetical protein